MLMAVPAGDGEAIRLKTRNLEREDLRRSLSEPLKRMASGSSHYVLRFPEPPGKEVKAALSAAGIETTAHISRETLVVSVPDAFAGEFERVADAGRLSRADKLSPALAEEATAYLVELYPDITLDTGREIVRSAGLDTLSHPDLLPNQLLVTGDAARVSSLADWDEVAYIFPASMDLVLGNHVLACAGALLEEAPVGQYVKMGAGWSKSGTGSAEIRYFFQNTTGKLARSTVESEILRALQEWSRYAPIDFVAAGSTSASRTISILFGSKSHGDNYPFDGRGKVLAHTFYPAPPNSEPLAGDMHLDADEDWQIGASTDLFSVALHEAGHALGLAHSDKPDSVMYPYYRQAGGLTADDISGIRALYGSRESSQQPSDPATPGTPAGSFALTVAATPASTAESTITLRGTVENATGQAQITWTSDRGGSGQATGSTAWTVTSVPLSLGSNTITVRAADQGSHTATKALAITRQSQSSTGSPSAPPGLKITSPAFSIVSTSLASITLRGTASSSGGISQVTWSTSAGESGNAAGTTSWTASVPLLQGTNTVTVRAYDAAGSSSWRALTVVRR